MFHGLEILCSISVLGDSNTHNILAFNSDLHIVGGFQLSVAHMAIFHIICMKVASESVFE